MPTPAAPSAVPLWPHAAPGALGSSDADIPALTRFDPAPGADGGASVLVFPGGGYGALAEHEGAGYARWFAARGVTAFVLRYRLGSSGYRHPIMLQDAARALRALRATARAEGRDVARVGVIGSSAGGHLAATLLTGFDPGRADSADAVERESSRPDYGVLCYPVISFVEHTHEGSCANLLGENAPPALRRELSADQRVTADTPPCFLWHTAEDGPVPVENSLLFAAALRRHRVPVELHVYERGAHGLGLPEAGKGAPAWDGALQAWLRLRKLCT